MSQLAIDFDRPAITPIDPHVDARDVKRLSGQNAAVLARLRQGPAPNYELASMCLNSRARISDLRARGYVIECNRKGDSGTTTYTLTKEPE